MLDALVLADSGIRCIDEFDKMSEVQSMLHEVMEQQTLCIAKTSIVRHLNIRTSLLTAANQRESQRNKTTIENIELPHTLQFRFYLIFLMLDPQDVALDHRLARHLMLLYRTTNEALWTWVCCSTTSPTPGSTSSRSRLIRPPSAVSGLSGHEEARQWEGPDHDLPLSGGEPYQLAEARAAMQFSASVEFQDVEAA